MRSRAVWACVSKSLAWLPTTPAWPHARSVWAARGETTATQAAVDAGDGGGRRRAPATGVCGSERSAVGVCGSE